jgi:SAM-dependent methyltransferase
MSKFWDLYKLMDKALYLSEERTVKETDLIHKLFSINKVKSFIDFGCGDGRITIPLVQRGYAGYGIDLDLDEVNEAKRKSTAITGVQFDCIDFREFDDTTNKYGAALFVYSSFGYFDDTENQKLLYSVGKCINSGGIIFIDLLSKDWSVSRSQGTKDLTKKVKVLSNDFKQVIRSRTPEIVKGLLYEVTKFQVVMHDNTKDEYTYQQRLFSKAEIEKLLSNAGFENFQFLGNYENEQYGVDSPRMITIAHKI